MNVGCHSFSSTVSSKYITCKLAKLRLLQFVFVFFETEFFSEHRSCHCGVVHMGACIGVFDDGFANGQALKRLAQIDRFAAVGQCSKVPAAFMAASRTSSSVKCIRSW